MIDLQCCDNITLLKKIKSETIDLIYNDILFNTGRNFYNYADINDAATLL